MATVRDVGDITTDPGGKSGTDWTTDVRDSIIALWALLAGRLTSIAGTNTITASVAVSSGFTALGDGMKAVLVPAATNTGAVTLNVESLGAKAVVNPDGSALASGALDAATAYLIIFISASDHWRVIGSAGTTNVTIQGGIILQRAAPARLAASTAPTTALTSIATKAFTLTASDSRAIIEGAVSRLTDAGVESNTGFDIHLYVDTVLQESITDAISPDQQAITPFAFEYLPADTDAHTYEVRCETTLLTAYIQSSSFIVMSEMSPN